MQQCSVQHTFSVEVDHILKKDEKKRVERMKETLRKDRKEKLRMPLSGPDLNSLENGSSTLKHSLTVNGLNYSESENLERKVPIRNAFQIPFLVVVWYGCACISITSSKKVMNELPLPFLLCASQFLIASVMVGFYSKFVCGSYKKIPPSARTLVYQISLSYTFGFIFTNTAFSLVSASFAETIKSAEPLSSVFLGYFYFNEGNTLSTYLTLLPICMGVSISCMHDGSFGLLGFLCAAISNICFSSRAVLTKHLFRTQKESITMDEVCLFTHISQIGLMVLIPMTVIVEGKLIWNYASDTSLNIDVWGLLFLLGVNGVFYSVYNLTSFLVLSRTDLISHAVFNVFRRVVIIVFTSCYFSIILSPLNIVGIAVAVFGVLLFCYSRSKEKKSPSTLTK